MASAGSLPLNIFYQISFIYAYMALLFISNNAPPSIVGFNPIRHLHRGDVTLHSGYLVINLRWTKTLQRYRQLARIKLFPIPNSSLCPLKAFCQLQCSYPVRPTDPFLSHRTDGALYLITQSDLRRVLKKLVGALGFHNKKTFHAFGRSRTSLAYASGISIDTIQAHGTRASDALWCYSDADTIDTTVPQFFSRAFSGL
jgi:integrase